MLVQWLLNYIMHDYCLNMFIADTATFNALTYLWEAYNICISNIFSALKDHKSLTLFL